VSLPNEYPFKSPSIGFGTRIFHPNIDEVSGSVCLDVINQTWSPMYELVNIFSIFLPQLLLYPNPKDPLNSEAARLLINDEKAYNSKVKDYVARFACSHKSVKDKSKDTNAPEKSKIVPGSKNNMKQYNDKLSETSIHNDDEDSDDLLNDADLEISEAHESGEETEGKDIKILGKR